MNENDIYDFHILRHYEEPSHRGHLERATDKHREDNPLCGDSVQVELKINEEGVIEEARFVGVGCCISQAAASMLMERIEGMTTEKARQFSARDMLAMFGARLTPLRQNCCLLAWKAVQVVINSRPPRPLGAEET